MRVEVASTAQNGSKTLNDKTNVVHVNFGARAQTLKLAA